MVALAMFSKREFISWEEGEAPMEGEMAGGWEAGGHRSTGGHVPQHLHIAPILPSSPLRRSSQSWPQERPAPAPPTFPGAQSHDAPGPVPLSLAPNVCLLVFSYLTLPRAYSGPARDTWARAPLTLFGVCLIMSCSSKEDWRMVHWSKFCDRDPTCKLVIIMSPQPLMPPKPVPDLS